MTRRRMTRAFGLVLALVLLVFPLRGTIPSATAMQTGLEDGQQYESPQFGYIVSWGDDWSARDRDVISNPGGFDTMVLRGSLGTLMVQGQGDETTAADAVEARIQIEGSADDVLSSELDGDVPQVKMQLARDTALIEGYTLPENDAVVIVVLSAPERDFDDALASVHEQVEFNGGQILTGEPIGAGDAGDADDTGDTGEEGDARNIEEPVEADEAVPEERPTESPAADEPTPAPADAEEPNGDGTYTGDVYGYTLEYDASRWDVTEEIQSRDSDGLLMSSETGTLMIWGLNQYGADPVACLDGESDYYEFEDEAISDWEPAEDADGEPIRYETDEYAYGVFTLTHTLDGDEAELVDYIECRVIPGADAVVIIMGSTSPDLYNEHLDHVLDVAETITFDGDDPAESQGESSTTTEGSLPGTALDGSLYTSPSFGFTIDIPAQWQIVDESLAAGDEQLVLDNGTSEVTIRATEAYSGGLAECVDFAADQAPTALELAENAEGEPFRGSDRNGAYGNYLYDNGDQAYFISCQTIVEDESVLILTQDVPADQQAAQRKFRIDLQQAIEFP